MPNPWERYQQQEAGPWDRYAPPETAEAEGSTGNTPEQPADPLDRALGNAFEVSDRKPSDPVDQAIVDGFGKIEDATDKSFYDKANEAILSNPAGRVASQFAASVNRGAADILDFFTVDQVNAVRQLIGKEPDIPTMRNVVNKLAGGDLKGPEVQFMDEGLGRDVVSGAGEVIPAALTGGALLRSAASTLPAVTGTTKTLPAVVKQMGSTTAAAADIGYGAASGVGAELGEEVGGDAGRMVGSVAAPLAVASSVPALKESVRQVFRGGEAGRKAIAQTIDDFAKAGATPTVAEATDRPSLQAIENISGKFIGGGPINKAREATTGNIQARLSAIADDISAQSGDDIAGLKIKKAITGEGGFLDRFKGRSKVLWDDVDSAIGEDSVVGLGNTTAALDDMVKTTPIGQELNNPLLVRLKAAIDQSDDASYSVLKELRSSIGERLGSKELASDIPRAQLKRLYGAISRDIESTAESIGDDVLKQYKRANAFSSAGHDRIGGFVGKITKKDEFDKIFSAITKGGEGSQVINSFKRSMKPEEWEVVASNVVRKLGKATPGAQDAGADVFSVQKFLTDWNKLGPAKKALFSGSPKINQYGRDLDLIAKTAERVKFSGKEAANPSGSGQFVANIGAATTGAGAAVTGNIPLLGGVVAAIGANNLGSRLMTNPRFVRALARETSKPSPSYAALFTGLAKAAEKSDIDDAVAIDSLLENMGYSDQNPIDSSVNNSDEDDEK